MPKRSHIAMFLIPVLLAGVFACSPDRPPNPAAPPLDEGTPAGAVGRVRIELVDAPGEFTAVNILIDSVEAHAAADDATGGWHVLSDEPGWYDLLALTNGISAVLADSTAPTGSYDQLRLILGAGCTVEVGGALHDLKIPSGMESGIKIAHDFSVAEGRISNLVLDFDAAASIRRLAGGGGNGKDRYLMSPVIRAVDAELTGGIAGTVLPTDAHARLWTVAGSDTVATLADAASGAFVLAYLPAGRYDVHVAASAGAPRDTLLAGLDVLAGELLDLGVIELDRP